MHWHHAGLDEIFWVGGILGDTALMIVLLGKNRVQKFPAFTSLIALNILADLLLRPISRSPHHTLYVRLYWSYAFANVLVQAWIILELAAVVLRPTGTWVRDARANFISWGLAGAIIALALAYLVSPPAATEFGRLSVQADLFTSMLICELAIVMTSSSTKLGLGWRNHVMAVGQGLTFCTTIGVVIDSVHSYLGNVRSYDVLEYIKFFAYLATTVYWCVQLWREEPVRQPISPELRNYIVALHHRVQYDLGEAER